MKIIKKLFICTLLLFTAFFSIAIGYYLVVTKDAELQADKLLLSDKNITLYDERGELANVALNAQGLQALRLADVPKVTLNTFVTVEDKRFFSHNGFDRIRIVKALLNNIRYRSFKEGASTISQQLIKNTHLSQEKTLKRKLREWKLTRALEKAYTKEEILEKYLSVIYFGHNCFGLSSAARFYFGKTPDQLDLADSAILAGLVRSPNNYSPFKNPKNCARRKETVLELLVKNGVVSELEKQSALSKPLPTEPTVSGKRFGYAHFVFDELAVLAERYGFTVGGNVKLYTYLDPTLQKRLETIAEQHSRSDVIMSVLDVQTGGFKACASTVGNVKRLPGSLIKPLLVYAPAIEEDLISPATPLLDEKIDFGGYAPKNYDGEYRGYTSARECLAKSLNVPAVKLLSTLGVDKGIDYLSRVRLNVDKDDASLALALGGMKEGFNLHELMSAYKVFPSGGTYSECGFIKKIVIDGKTAYVAPEGKKRVYSEETAYLTTDMLKTTAKTGTAKKLKALPFEIAAKTGTAGSDKGNTDAYALSYTTHEVAGVWLGNASGGFIEYTGGGLPCNYLLEINRAIDELYHTNKPFKKPKGVERVELDKTCYYDTHTLCLADENAPAAYRFSELFKSQCKPTKKCDFFSNPSILCPTLSYEKNSVKIVFDDACPTFYQYKIDRYDYATHNTVYYGDFTKIFIDEKLQRNKKYLYTVTPFYNGIRGSTVILPAVSTGENDLPFIPKEWWREQ